MAPLTAAERSKCYREKSKAKLLKRNALRKRLKRVEMKITSPEKNTARLLKERLYLCHQFLNLLKADLACGPHIYDQCEK